LNGQKQMPETQRIRRTKHILPDAIRYRWSVPTGCAASERPAWCAEIDGLRVRRVDCGSCKPPVPAIRRAEPWARRPCHLCELQRVLCVSRRPSGLDRGYGRARSPEKGCLKSDEPFGKSQRGVLGVAAEGGELNEPAYGKASYTTISLWRRIPREIT
jgi:hypothetical protein